MSSEHVELVRRALDAMSRGDVEALSGLCTDDMLFLPGRSALQGGYVGPAGLRKWFADTAETFDVFSATWDEIHEAGEQVVTIGHVRVRPRGGGPEASVPAAFVVTFKNGKIARAEDLRDRSAALASVGLSVKPTATEVVRSFYEAHEAGDLATRQSLLDPGFEFIPLDGTVVHGRHGLLRALDDMADQFRTYDVHASRFVTVDDATVVVEVSRAALTHRGDVPVTDRFAQLFSLRDGLVLRVQSFRTVDDALASAGAP